MPTIANWYGIFKINYTIVNEFGRTSSANVMGSVSNVFDKPVAVQDDAAVCVENAFVDILDVVANDTDVDNWPAIPTKPANYGLKISSVSAGGGFATAINGDTGIRFTPFPGWNSIRNSNGEFSVTYYVKDAEGLISNEPVVIPITVTPKNAPPRANSREEEDDDEGTEDEPFSFSTLDDGGIGDEYANQVLTYEVVNAPSNGTVAADGFGGWVYTPFSNYNGGDSFGYIVTDDALAGPTSGLSSDVTTVSLVIQPVNDQPIAHPQSGITTNEDTPVGITLTGEDGDALPVGDQSLTFEITAHPQYGEVTVNETTGVATYTPHPNENGPDSFAFSVYDGIWSEPASVSIAVAAINDAPQANDEGYFATGGSGQVVVMELDPIFNDEDLDGDDVSIVSATNGTYTLVTVNGDGTVTAELQPDFPFEYTDTFSYLISDGNGGTDSAIVSLISGFHPLMAEGEPPALTPALSPRERELRPEALRPIVAEARARWEEAGVGAGVLSTLDTAEFRLTDLNGSLLAIAIGNTVLIDRDAAGFGWFVDATPENDWEFRQHGGELVARRGSDAAGRRHAAQPGRRDRCLGGVFGSGDRQAKGAFRRTLHRSGQARGRAVAVLTWCHCCFVSRKEKQRPARKLNERLTIVSLATGRAYPAGALLANQHVASATRHRRACLGGAVFDGGERFRNTAPAG